MLHINICYKSLTRRVLLKGSEGTEITVAHTTNWTCNLLRHYGCEVTDNPPNIPATAPSDYRLFGPPQKHLAGKQIAT